MMVLLKIKTSIKFIHRSRRIVLILLLFFVIGGVSAWGRDINLDRIYLKKNSSFLKKITQAKLQSYKIAGAIPVDSGIIFSDWISGRKLIYIKEYKSSNVNYLYEYYPETRKPKKVMKINGAIIYTKLSNRGQYLYIKKIVTSNAVPKSVIQVIRITRWKSFLYGSQSYSKDFSLSPDGSSFYQCTNRGVVRIFPGGSKRVILKKKYYSRYGISGNIVPFVSAGNTKILLLSGGGGSYKGYLFEKKNFSHQVTGVSSVSEAGWINNRYFVFRKGYPAFYRVVMYDVLKMKYREISDKSYNCNITFSYSRNYINYIEDGIINFYNVYRNKKSSFPLEGEDVKFAPDDNTFCILYDKHLYIAKREVLDSKRLFLKRNAEVILDLYDRVHLEKKIWENEYTENYIIRKKEKYSEFLSENI